MKFVSCLAVALVSLTALNFAVQAEEGPSDVTSNQLFLNTFSPEEIDNYNHTQADPPQSNSQSDVDSNTSTAQNSQPSDHSFPTDTIQGHSAFTSSKSNLHVDTSQLAHHPHANKLHSAPNPPPKHEINAQPALSTPAYNPFIEYPPLTQTIQSIYQQYKPPINTQSGAYVLPSLPFPSLQNVAHTVPISTRSKSPWNSPPGTFSPESYFGPLVYQGQRYEGQIRLYQSYLYSNSFVDYSSQCSKNPNQSPRIFGRDLDQAFAYAIAEVQAYDNVEQFQYRQGKYLNVSNPFSSSIRHQIPTYIQHLTPSYFKEREALLMEFASKYLIKNNCISRLDASLLLPQVNVNQRPLKDYTCNYLHSHNAGQKTINCTRFIHSPYRSADGSCNSLLHPYWGKANICHLRLVASAYDDGIAAPRQSSFRFGLKLPNVRAISQAAHPEVQDQFFYTHMVMAWGQYVNHDITFTPKSQPQYKDGVIDCCRSVSDDSQLHPQCFPIRLAANDYQSQKYGKSCFNFVRSAACPLCSLGPRQQINLVTSFLDLSLTYGNSRSDQNSLRAFRNGQLRSGADRFGREALPPSNHWGRDQCSSSQNQNCFRAGDGRVNQYPGLIAMHTLFQRRHNQHARGLQQVNPHWSDEQLFQEARRLLIAEFQHVTFEEYLPLVFGPTLSAYYNLLSPARSYRGYHGAAYTVYESNTDPTTWNEYSAAACRYGHSQISGFFSLIGGFGFNGHSYAASHSYSNQSTSASGYWLRDQFFDASLMINGHLDAMIRGFVTDRSQVVDPFVAEDVKNYLYKGKHEKIGSDLIAFNIQRGRDHGLPAYHVYLDFCFGFKACGWHDLAKFIPAAQLNVLRGLYADFRDVDLYTGGLSEKKFPDASVGPTFACILGIQFYHLKFGDRYFYSHGLQAGSFTPVQLNNIQNRLSLANFLCKATDYLNEIQQKPLLPASHQNPIVKCSSFLDLDYRLWQQRF